MVAIASARALTSHMATAARNITPATAVTCIAENANTKKIGNAIALCTAQSRTGAIGNARAGTTRRVIREMSRTAARRQHRTQREGLMPLSLGSLPFASLSPRPEDVKQPYSAAATRPNASCTHAAASVIASSSELLAPLPSPFSKSPSTQPSRLDTWARQITGRDQAVAKA
jgi:hypothetical protein